VSKNQGEINEQFITVDGLRFRVRASPDLGSSTSKLTVVLFHGFSFSLGDWEKTGTLNELKSHSLPYLAVDLPRGKATKSQRKEMAEMKNYVPVLENLFRSAGIDLSRSKLIIVGPSMGGAFALTYALEKPDQVSGLVLIAPSLAGIDRDRLEDLNIPVLLVWGEKDTVFPLEEKGRELKQILPQAKLLIIKGARHPAYLDRPEEFHELLIDFIDEVAS
jgi:abhydrolase domain-containing protein 14